MSWSKWLAGDFHPARIKASDFGPYESPVIPRWRVLLRFVVAVAVMCGLIWLVVRIAGRNGVDPWILSGGIGMYLLIGYYFRPEPDESDLGWFGGLVDNPFSVTDNINRWLLWLKLLLAPGTFMAEAFLDTLTLLTHAAD